MPVYKEEKTNTWRAVYRYTDWTGDRKQSQKRGFKTKREALAWEREQLNKCFPNAVPLYINQLSGGNCLWQEATVLIVPAQEI